METSGYVLVCESFEFDHDYKVIAFSKDAKPLNDHKASLEADERSFESSSKLKRSYYIFPL